MLCALLFPLVAWTFLPAVQNGFVKYDDQHYITENPHVQRGLTQAGLAWALRSTTAANWHPLTWLSHMLDCQLFGLRSWGHHLTSILLHALNAVLLFLVLRRLTGVTWRSLFVATLFGLHPLRVESVAWAAERKDVLSTLFWFLTMLAYGRYARRQTALAERAMNLEPAAAGRWQLDYALALLFFALGLMSKPMLVTLPFVLLLLDHWPLDRWRRPGRGRLLLEKMPFFLLAAAASVLTFIVQKKGHALLAMAEQSFTARVGNAAVSYARYLCKVFWPENLSVIYPAVDSWPPTAVSLSVLLILGFSAFATALGRRRPYVPVGWLWFVGTLLPVVGLVAIGDQSLADRYSYVPTVGVLIMVVWGVHDLTNRWRTQAAALSSAAAALAVACIFLTRDNIGNWESTEALFTHAVAVTRGNYRAHGELGALFLGQGRIDEALDQLREAARLRPAAAAARNNLGAALALKGLFADAIVEFRGAARLRPDDAETRFNLGKALEDSGQLGEAIEAYEQALKLNPNSFVIRSALAAALNQRSRLNGRSSIVRNEATRPR